MNVVLSVILVLVALSGVVRDETRPGHLFAAILAVVALWALWNADRLLGW